jgi:hypothetical protein
MSKVPEALPDVEDPGQDKRWRAIKRFYLLINATGFAFLLGYLYITRDFAFSLPWTLGFPLITITVAVTAGILKLDKRFPKLERHLFARKWTHEELSLPYEERRKRYEADKLRYMQSMISFRNMLSTPAEDGLICVPIILIGLNPLVAISGALAFGILHAVGHTYIGCILKVLIYSLVTLLVLPHGLLTVVAGHVANNMFALVLSKVIQRLPA